jgi:HTH-type transcriptional regulator / antitoxin HigA
METPMKTIGSSTYADLLAEVQPRTIRDEDEADRIRTTLDVLMDKEEPTEAEWEMMALLGDVLSVWEQNTYHPEPISVPEKIRSLLEAHNAPQKALVGPVFTTESVVSDVLHGRRRLNYEQVGRLAAFFHVSPALFYTVEPADPEKPARMRR